MAIEDIIDYRRLAKVRAEVEAARLANQPIMDAFKRGDLTACEAAQDKRWAAQVWAKLDQDDETRDHYRAKWEQDS
jgi:hypothetical protein